MAVDAKYALMLCALMAPTLVNGVFASDRDFARIQRPHFELHVRPGPKIRGCQRCEETYGLEVEGNIACECGDKTFYTPTKRWNEMVDKCYRHHGHIVFSTGHLRCEIPSQRSK